MKHYFITGIGTEVGKTVASAIITQAIEADYWKPIQAGDLEDSDTHKLKKWVSNTKTKFYSNAYQLKTPMSPHAAADIDGVEIEISKINRPSTENNLVIEGAGGLLVPINKRDTIANLIKTKDCVIVVSRHYLGSINHTLLTLSELKKRKIKVAGIIFNGNEHTTTESIITKMSGVCVIGRINQHDYIDKEIIKKYADKFKNKLLEL